MIHLHRFHHHAGTVPVSQMHHTSWRGVTGSKCPKGLRGYIHLHKNITVTFTYVRKHGILKYNMDGYVSMCVYFDIICIYI